jgi:hypothetical protein
VKFDPFLFANICVGIAGVCYLLAFVGYLVTAHYAMAGAFINYASANGFLVWLAIQSGRGSV